MAGGSEEKHVQRTGLDLYSRLAFAGAVCCSITHGGLTPVDVVKTRIQLNPGHYNSGMIGGFKTVIKEEGAMALLTGFGPTAAGYALQGAFKFAGYEFWKSTLINAVGVENAPPLRTPIFLTSAAIAEFFADIVLCPLEATRIRLVSNPTYADGLVGGFTKIAAEDGILHGFYSGFIPMLFKQVPYTMAKFVVYEEVSSAIFKAAGGKDSLSDSMLTTINLGSGLIAGLAAAVISQPADTMLSIINKEQAKEGETIFGRLAAIATKLGPKGLFTGLGARLVMIGTLTAGQFAIYGDIKKALGATGGVQL